MRGRFARLLLISVGGCSGADHSMTLDADATVMDAAADADDTTGFAASDAFLAWRSDFYGAICARDLRCESPPPYPSQRACLDDIDDDLVAAEPRIAASILSGHTEFFAARADACLAKYDEDCDTPPTDILTACNEVYRGVVATGEACVGHFECLDPAGLERSFCFDGCTALFGYEASVEAGICVAESPIGAPPCD